MALGAHDQAGWMRKIRGGHLAGRLFLILIYYLFYL